MALGRSNSPDASTTQARKPHGRHRGGREYAGLCTRTIYRYIADGRITGYRIGPKLIKVDLDELDRIIKPVPATAAG